MSFSVPLTTDMSQIRNGLERVKVGGSSKLAKGITTAVKQLKRTSKIQQFCGVVFKPRVVILTSGVGVSKEKALETVQVVRELGIVDFEILHPSECDMDFLVKLSKSAATPLVRFNVATDVHTRFYRTKAVELMATEPSKFEEGRVQKVSNKLRLEWTAEEVKNVIRQLRRGKSVQRDSEQDEASMGTFEAPRNTREKSKKRNMGKYPFVTSSSAMEESYREKRELLEPSSPKSREDDPLLFTKPKVHKPKLTWDRFVSSCMLGPVGIAVIVIFLHLVQLLPATLCIVWNIMTEKVGGLWESVASFITLGVLFWSVLFLYICCSGEYCFRARFAVFFVFVAQGLFLAVNLAFGVWEIVSYEQGNLPDIDTSKFFLIKALEFSTALVTVPIFVLTCCIKTKTEEMLSSFTL